MIYEHLPIKALSIRQPWAWAILNAGKDIENRDWKLPREFAAPKRIALHASKGLPWDEWKYAAESITQAHGSLRPPYPDDLQRGGIVGSVLITGCTTESDSPWFFGQYGFMLSDPQPCDFIPVKGALGFFDWRRNLT